MTFFSVVVITHNEADNITRCLEAALTVSDDVVVLDSNSDDDTRKLSIDAGARVFERTWEGYASAKNYANDLAKYDWILSIDADEVISPELQHSLKILKPENGLVYCLDRLSQLGTQWIKHSGWYPDWKPRLFNRNDVQWTGDYVHEKLHIPKGFNLVRLKGKLHHYSYKNIEDYHQRSIYYASLAAQRMYNENKKVSFFQQRCLPVIKYLKVYIFKLGFLDGKAGQVLSNGAADFQRMKMKKLKHMWEDGNSSI